MSLWQLIGLVAHVCLLGIGTMLIWRAVPQLRKSCRCRDLVIKVLLVKLAVLIVLAIAVTEIHFIATEVWHVAATVVLTAIGLWLLRKQFRQLVAPPRHRASWLNQISRPTPMFGRTSNSGSHRAVAVRQPQ